jgi:hypothetical protein
MIEVVTRERSPEMAARYQGTYGFLKNGAGKKILVNIINVDARFTTVQDSKGNDYTLASDTGCELEFTQVPSQWFQPDPKHIAYVTRRPERQYKRGICDNNTSMYIPNKSGSALLFTETTPDRIEALFGPVEENDSFRTHTPHNCGLWSKFFAWVEEYVYAKDMLIGTVDHKAGEVTLHDDLFLQEVRDAIARSNAVYSVKVKNA